MRRVFALFLVAVLPGAAFSFARVQAPVTPDPAFDPAAVSARVTVASVKDGQRGLGFGSGVVVGWRDGKAYVLTCKHVADPADGDVEVELPGQTAKPGLIICRAHDCDLALIGLPCLERPAVSQIALETPPIGRRVLQHGFGGLLRRSRVGKGMDDEPDYQHTWYYEGVCVNGDSGSGVWQLDGKLVGVVWGRVGTRKDQVACTGVEGIRGFLGRAHGWMLKPELQSLRRPEQRLSAVFADGCGCGCKDCRGGPGCACGCGGCGCNAAGKDAKPEALIERRHVEGFFSSFAALVGGFLDLVQGVLWFRVNAFWLPASIFGGLVAAALIIRTGMKGS